SGRFVPDPGRARAAKRSSHWLQGCRCTRPYSCVPRWRGKPTEESWVARGRATNRPRWPRAESERSGPAVLVHAIVVEDHPFGYVVWYIEPTPEHADVDHAHIVAGRGP